VAAAPRLEPSSAAVPKVRVPRLAAAPVIDLGRWDPALRVAWGASTGAVLLAVVALGAVLARRRRGWAAAVVDGVPVLVSADVGPAVVGLVRTRIVLPAWTLEADADARRLVLEHEREHVRAGDPRLLAAALILAALTPWSPAAWWMLRRLRLAIEVDCDARVLRRRADVRAYGSALLEVGRRTVRTRLAAAAFAEPVSSLERRIRIMTAPRVRRPLLRALGLGTIAALLAIAACETPGPTQPSPGSRRMYTAEGEIAGAPRAKISLREAVERYFPEVARAGLGPDEYLVFTVSAQGDVVGHQRLPSAPDAARAAVDPSHKIAVRGRETQMVMRDLDDRDVRSIDRMEQPAGSVAPTPVTVVWVQLRGPGDPPGAMRMSSSNPEPDQGDPPLPPNQVTGWNRGDGITGMVGVRGTAAGTMPTEAEFSAAIDRYWTPAMRAAGVHGQVAIRFRVTADGQPTGVEVLESDDSALDPVARSVVGELRFPGRPAGTQMRMMLGFGDRRTRDPLPHPTGPKR
jgi:TonB family protein